MASHKGAIVQFQLEQGKPPVEFRFDVATAQAMESRLGGAPWTLALRGQAVTVLVVELFYALQHSDPSITEKRAQRLLQRYLDSGGKVKALAEALNDALNQSNVYGTSDEPVDDTDEADDEDSERPLDGGPQAA